MIDLFKVFGKCRDSELNETRIRTLDNFYQYELDAISESVGAIEHAVNVGDAALLPFLG